MADEYIVHVDNLTYVETMAFYQDRKAIDAPLDFVQGPKLPKDKAREWGLSPENVAQLEAIVDDFRGDPPSSFVFLCRAKVVDRDFFKPAHPKIPVYHMIYTPQ